MTPPIAILSAIPAELVGFPEDDYHDILYTGVGKVNATQAISAHANHLKASNISVRTFTAISSGLAGKKSLRLNKP